MFGLALALAAYLLLSSLNWACSAGCFQANDTLALLAPVLLNRMQGQNSAFSLQNWKLKLLILISGEVTEGCGNGGGGGAVNRFTSGQTALSVDFVDFNPRLNSVLQEFVLTLIRMTLPLQPSVTEATHADTQVQMGTIISVMKFDEPLQVEGGSVRLRSC